MLYLIYNKEDTKQLVNILADNYTVITYDVKDINEKLVRDILKEEVELDDVLIVYKEDEKYIPLRYASLDYPLAYDSKNPTKILESTEDFISKETSKMDIYLNLMDYAVALDLEEFNAQINEMQERINEDNKLIFLEEDKDMLDSLDLDVTKENFEKIVELLNKKETFIYVQDETEYSSGLEIYINNLKDKDVQIEIFKNENSLIKEKVTCKSKKEIKLPKLKIEDDDILEVKLDQKTIYGK